MTEFDSFEHFIKKFYEIFHLYFKHYLPQGKPCPEYYRDVFYEMYKLWDCGKLPELTKEPIVEEVVFQMELFKTLPNSQLSLGGTMIEEDNIKT